MKNRLKGTTLIETVLYIAILTSILFVLVNFTLSTQEATIHTERRSQIYTNTEFITQHLDSTFSKISTIDEAQSSFDQDKGILYLNIQNEEHNYTLSQNKLLYDNTPISGNDVIVNSFNIQPLYNKKDIVSAVKISIQITSLRDAKVKKNITTLYTIR